MESTDQDHWKKLKSPEINHMDKQTNLDMLWQISMTERTLSLSSYQR
jgi:hypothetical protein